MAELTPTKKKTIMTMYSLGQKTAAIAAEIGCHPSTVCHNHKKLLEKPNPYAKPHRLGRPRKLDERSLRHAQIMVDSGKACDGADVLAQLSEDVGASTVRRNLAEIGLHGRVHWKKPFLKPEH
ncbi:hypothetical protein BV20DRAFT_906194, partial [Pilatotrama ljubarskyi]